MPDIPLTLSFHGAARTVTGSRHLIRFGDERWLFDCGIYQGHRDEADRINRTFRFDPRTLSAVVLSHAHLDHAGNLPTLVAQGFRGPIHATPPTLDLVRAMLADSASLMERDVDHVNRHRGGRAARAPLYGAADVERTLDRIVTHAYHEPFEVVPEATACFYDAGHILGSALTTFDFRNGGQSLRLGMGGDLGRPRRPILRDPESPPGVAIQVLESTYGNRLHPDVKETERELAAIVRTTAGRGGRLMVPSFAVGRTQELVAILHALIERGEAPDLPIYVDSPLARQATAVFRRHPEVFDAETRAAFEQGDGMPFGFARLRYVESPQESRALNDVREPCIVIAASGMCEGGRILHHLRHGLSNPANTVLFVGYQAEGTLGRRIRDGAEMVSVFGEPVRRKAEVRSLDGFSAHADQRELVEWTAGLVPAPRRIFLVHGEFEAAAVLEERLEERIAAQVEIPALGEEFSLWT